MDVWSRGCDRHLRAGSACDPSANMVRAARGAQRPEVFLLYEVALAMAEMDLSLDCPRLREAKERS